MVEFDRQGEVYLLNKRGKMFEVVCVRSDLRCLLIILLVVLSDKYGGEGSCCFCGLVALEIVAVGVDLVEDGDGCDFRSAVVDELPSVTFVGVGKKLQHVPFSL